MENFDDYQRKAASFRVPDSTPEERVFGLLEEAGEVAGVFKRVFRGDYNADQAAQKLFFELGDILWYLSQVASDNNWTLSDIAKENINKLESRKLRNALLGNGDTR